MTSVEDVSRKCDDNSLKLDKILDRLGKLDILESEIRDLKSSFDKDRKEIQEQETENIAQDKTIICKLIKEVLKLECAPESLIEVFRLGKPRAGGICPICTELSNSELKWEILRNKRLLIGTNIFVDADLPPELRQRGKETLQQQKAKNKLPLGSPEDKNNVKKTGEVAQPYFLGKKKVPMVPSR